MDSNETSNICYNCGKHIPAGASICPHCGLAANDVTISPPSDGIEESRRGASEGTWRQVLLALVSALPVIWLCRRNLYVGAVAILIVATLSARRFQTFAIAFAAIAVVGSLIVAVISACNMS